MLLNYFKFSFFALIIFITGCEFVPNKSLVFSSDTIPEGEGVIVAETYSNSEFIPKSPLGWDQLVIWQVDNESNKKTYSLTKIDDQNIKQKYAGYMPQGTYRIGLLYYSLVTSGYSEYVRAPTPLSLGTFIVKPKEITNLGTIYYHPFSDSHWLDDHFPNYSITREKNPNLIDYVNNKFPIISSQLDTTNLANDWIDDDFSHSRTAALDLIKKNEHISDLVNIKGKIFLLGKNGSIYHKRNNEWTIHDTGTNSRISDLLFYDGKYLITNDEGKIFVLNDEFKVVKELLLPNKQPIHSLHTLNNKLYFISQINNDEVNIYEANSSKTLSSINKIQLSTLKSKVKSFYLKSFVTKNHLHIVLGKNHFIYDPSKTMWDVQEAMSIADIQTLQNGVVVMRNTDPWKGWSNTKYSLDSTKSWTTTSVSERNMYYSTNGKQYYLHSGINLTFAKTFFNKDQILNKVPFYKSDDSGSTWYEIGELPRLCNQFLASESTDENFFVRCVSGDIYMSKDSGVNWDIFFKKDRTPLEDFPRNTVIYHKPSE